MNSFWNGKRRFVALLMFLAGVFVALRVPPAIPFIQLPGENFPEGYNFPITDIRLTNTMVGAVIVWVLLLLFVVYVSRRRPKRMAMKSRPVASTTCLRCSLKG